MTTTIFVFSQIDQLSNLIKEHLQHHLIEHEIVIVKKEALLLEYLNSEDPFLIIVNSSKELNNEILKKFPISQKILQLTCTNILDADQLSSFFEKELLKPLLKFSTSIYASTQRSFLAKKLYNKTIAFEETHYSLPSNPDLVEFWIPHFTNQLKTKFDIEEKTAVSIELSLREGIYNALFYGNYNISPELKKTEEGLKKFLEIKRKKQQIQEYLQKKIKISVVIKNNKLSISIIDEGDGFDYKKNNSVLLKNDSYGRGIALIKHYMDEVFWNEKGNCITMSKKL